MSDLLSGLVRYPGLKWPAVLVDVDDVREALLNPADEQVRQIISDLAFNEALMSWDRGHASQWGIVRAVLAAAAGGER